MKNDKSILLKQPKSITSYTALGTKSINAHNTILFLLLFQMVNMTNAYLKKRKKSGTKLCIRAKQEKAVFLPLTIFSIDTTSTIKSFGKTISNY